MASKKPLQLIKDFKSLKERKDHIPPDQYLKELVEMRSKLMVEFNEPHVSSQEIKMLMQMLNV